MITIRLMGGLGNQMFQYALGKHLAVLNDTDWQFDLVFLNHRVPSANYVFRQYDLDIFGIPPKGTLLSRISPRARNATYVLQRGLHGVRRALPFGQRVVTERQPFVFDPDVLETKGPTVYLDGHWQNPRYFEGIADEIRRDFSTFPEPLSTAGEEIRREIEATDAVCVNFRRGDYVSNEATRGFHGVIGPEYYEQALRLVAEQVARPHLFVFSDDIEWCRANFVSEHPTTFVDYTCAGRKYAEDMRLMIACKHYVISNSTFSWWAAWLDPSDDSLVIAPKPWVADPRVDASGIYPDGWTVLETGSG
jgi:hypothetical protein